MLHTFTHTKFPTPSSALPAAVLMGGGEGGITFKNFIIYVHLLQSVSTSPFFQSQQKQTKTDNNGINKGRVSNKRTFSTH